MSKNKGKKIFITVELEDEGLGLAFDGSQLNDVDAKDSIATIIAISTDLLPSLIGELIKKAVNQLSKTEEAKKRLIEELVAMSKEAIVVKED